MTPPSSSKPAAQFHSRRHLQQDPHPSAISIRNMVNHFTEHSIMNPPNSTAQGIVSDASQAQKSTHRQPHKRQARRRLHTARPYHHSLLNMAEARKEIVTALKFHRASLQKHPPKQHLQPPCSHRQAPIMFRTNPTNGFSNLVDDFSLSSLSHPTLSSLPNPLNCPTAPPPAPPLIPGSLCYNLPNRALGLNLNFQDFDNLDAVLNSHSSPSSSSSPSLSVPTTDQDVPSVAISQGEGTSAAANAIDSFAATEVATGDGGMEEILLQGERCQAEWNDAGNLVASVLWPKFVRNMEHQSTEDDVAHTIFDGPMQFPDWLNANERCFEQCSQEYVVDPALPCLDIGDFECMGEEWLA